MARTRVESKPTMVQLTERLLRLLDARAARAGTSRSQVIRAAVEAYLHDEEGERLARAYQDGYGRIPAGTPDEWGDPEAWHDGLLRVRAGHGDKLEDDGGRAEPPW